MNRFFICALFLLLGACPSIAKGLLLNIHFHDNSLSFDTETMQDTLSKMNYDLLNYTVDRNLTIGENTDRIERLLKEYGNKEVFLLTDRLSTFVGLDVISKDTTIYGLITLTGAYNDGESFLYDDVSIKKNLEMMDSISYDGSKERYLKTVYRMIQDKKKGKKIKLSPQADNLMQDFYTLLNSPYGTSMIDFSLEEHLRSIKSWIGFMTDDERRLELEIDFMNLSWTANKYGVKYTCPFSYRTDYCVAMVKNMISYLQQKK